MTSIIVTSRVEGNINHNLNELIRSLKDHSIHPEAIELLVKFDDDDKMAEEVQGDILSRVLPFRVEVAIGPRYQGYTSIHHGYNQLLPLLSTESQIVIAMADDFRAEVGWDFELRKAAQDGGDYFIIHQRPHPQPKEKFLKSLNILEERKPFDMSCDMFNSSELYIIDEAPAWSTKLLEACVLPLDVNDIDVFPVSFTDAWTLCLEYCLWHTHQLDLTKFLANPFISRKTCEVDQSTHERWDTDRKSNFEYINSEEFRQLVAYQAKEISCQLKQTAS